MDDKRSTPWLAIVLIVSVILPTLYVLSSGPAWGLVTYGHLRIETFLQFYGPLLWLGEIVPPLAAAMDWYSEWFENSEHGGTPPI